MAGDEESRARHVLADMQLRISQGPTSALGIGEIVTPDEVRAAFLELTKRFHPARFGRMSTDLQRMSNEVFLGIKAAHDHMVRALGGVPRGASTRTSTGAIPIISADGTNRTAHGGTPAMGVPYAARATGAMPKLSSPSPASSPAAGGSTTPVPPGTQPGVGVPVRPTTTNKIRAIAPVPPGTQPGVAPPASASSSSQRLPRMDGITPPTQPPGGGAASSPPQTGRVPTNPLSNAPTARPATNPLSTPPTARPATNPLSNPPTGRGPVLPRTAPDSFNPPTVRNVAPPANVPTVRFGSPPPGGEPFDEAAAFRDAAAHMERKDWAAARQALHALAAKIPQSKTYRAWLCYARGREAYLAGRPDDAILEMQRALQLEPDLAHAKHALTELQRRR